ncbi:MAG TPA: hypothetical protein VEB66_13335, partial [Opitutaceae bacterium]|nr:hypothetical protein [Opitutaceae bacterium]
MSRSCPACQTALTPKSRFCPSCGAATPLDETVDTPTSQATQVSRSSAEAAAPSTRTLDAPVPPRVEPASRAEASRSPVPPPVEPA